MPKRSVRFVEIRTKRTAAATLSEFAANPRRLGAMGAFTLVPHTWTQDLRRHVQVHVLMACGGLDDEDHLSRYTHRVAVSNERIAGITGGAVRLRVRADDHGGKRSVFIDGAQFIGRFLRHVLPPGFKRIRHYGLLSPALKTERMAAARAALNMPAANPQAREDAAAFLARVTQIDAAGCPHCGLGHWRTIQTLQRPRPGGGNATSDGGDGHRQRPSPTAIANGHRHGHRHGHDTAMTPLTPLGLRKRSA